MGYHKADIPRGKYGEASKITEEYDEFIDAINQDNPLMALQELSDLIGAIEGYASKYNMTLDDLLTMHKVTKKVFLEGHRTPRE